MTTNDLLSWGTHELQRAIPDDASRDAEHLLAHVTEHSREHLLSHLQEKILPPREIAYQTMIRRRRQGEPLAYILERAWFFGLPLRVTPDVLIPRPETELLVDHALRHLRDRRYGEEATVIDVGTGCGAIVLALAASCPPQTRFFATDISPRALTIAKENAALHHLRSVITFAEGNLLDPLRRHLTERGKQTIITANLPYLPQSVYAQNPTLAHEPRIALLGGDDGLDIIRGLFAALEHLSPPWTLLLEIDPTIKESLHDLLLYSFPSLQPKIVNDLLGHPRLCVLQQPLL